jgi:hypothetical protein
MTSPRDRLSTRPRPASQAGNDESSGSAKSADPPFYDYDRLNERHVMARLSHHSQVELAAIEDYERAHKNRVPVLDKLRYMRGREPLTGYDAFSVEEIVAALEDADLATIKEIRDYERRFANRPDVLAGVANAARGPS